MDRLNQTVLRGRPVTSSNAAHANEYFEHFLNASTLKTILGYYRNICDLIHLKPNVYPQFYPKLRANLTSWRAKALWKKFDARSSHKCYAKGKACPNTRVLIIGAGPCGLRAAIEAQLLGAKVVVVEKRDRMSRNNVLHLWPFVIEDLRALGAKKFFGKFCAGAIDHISIRQLQCILLKAALLLGVEVHTEVSFERLIEPNIAEKTGWRAEFKPSDHPIAQYEFDVIIGADGKRNTLQGFKRKEFRGKLAIAITANFINKRTEAEAIVEEISGVAFIFNQKFFKDLYADTGIDLENIVYYKDDTHYFVMTAKKPSLIDKGVIKQDLADTARLLAPDNVNREALMNYAREAAEFSTNYQLPDLEFAVNHYGQPDVAMFDFTSMYAAENASKFVERNGYRLLMILVGDSLLEPFWPTGSGCARGFLSSLDAGWAIRSWGSGSTNALEVLAERESIYRLLAQTTPDNLNKDWKAYTLDPATRYPNLNRNVVLPHQTISLFDTDNPKNLEKLRKNSQDLILAEMPKKRRREEIDNEVLINWIKEQIKEHVELVVTDIGSVFKDGRVLCAILNHYRPDLVDYSVIKSDEPAKNNQIAFDILEKELGIVPLMTGEEMTKTDDYLTMALYLTQVYDTFRCEIPHIKHPKLDISQRVIEPPLSITKAFPKESFIPPCMLKKPVKLKPLKNYGSADILRKNSGFQVVKKGSSSTRTPFDYWLENNEPFLLSHFKGIESSEDADNSSNYSDKNRNNKQQSLKLKMQKSDSLNDPSFFSKLSAKFGIHKANQWRKLPFTQSDSFITTGSSSSKVVFYDENFNELRSYDVVNNISQKRDRVVMHNSAPGEDKFCDGSAVSSNDVRIRLVEDSSYNMRAVQELKYDPKSNYLLILPKQCSEIINHDVPYVLRNLQNPVGLPKIKNRRKCHTSFYAKKLLKPEDFKFLLFNNMSEEHIDKTVPPEQVYDRVVNWLSVNDFNKKDQDQERYKLKEPLQVETNILDGLTDITSITQEADLEKRRKQIIVDEKTHVVSCDQNTSEKIVDDTPKNSEENFTAIIGNFRLNNIGRALSKLTNYAPCQTYVNKIKTATKKCSIIPEEECSEIPESKRQEPTFSKLLYTGSSKNVLPTAAPPTRPSSRHKRHADAIAPIKPSLTADRKTRKRSRTMDKIGASVVSSCLLYVILDTGVLVVLLFVFDLLFNAEVYGLENLLFS